VEFGVIAVKKEGRIATITLNRPEVLNVINRQMVLELTVQREVKGRNCPDHL